MQYNKAIKTIEKYLGVEVYREDYKYTFQYNDHIGSFSVHNDGTISSFHCRRINDHSDLMSDYFAGNFYNNLRQLIHSMKPPPPKFSEGALIRIKENKRATRWGINGRTGLIVTAKDGGQYSILWNDTNTIEDSCYERDMEEI
ncbi:MAG: hypothetical protein H8E12_09045 [Rhodobacteraceae bacterium]|nr:hypothetical protein [Paracoccaceae bacterium]